MIPKFRNKFLDFTKSLISKNVKIPYLNQNKKFNNNLSKFNHSIKDDAIEFSESDKFIENLYNNWKKDRYSVDKSWNDYFTSLEIRENSNQTNLSNKINQNNDFQKSSTLNFSCTELNKVNLLIRSYQKRGYLKANLDPLNLDLIDRPDTSNYLKESRQTLDYKNYQFSEQDLDKEFLIYTHGVSGILSESKPLKLREIISRLDKAYCGTISVEYLHLSSREECNFFREKFENEWVTYQATSQEKLGILDKLASAVLFEEFLRNKFTFRTRFGLEGMESMISGLKWLVDIYAANNIKDITLGMAHRGRLNVLANVMKKPLTKIFAEFQGKDYLLNEHTEDSQNQFFYLQTGDVNYHLGTFHENSYKDGKTLSMDLLPNPSHLEAVDPVILGKTRAKQHFNDDPLGDQHKAILIHGDASFSGQGVVYETLQLENLPHFKINGVLHVIANNQLGYTTTPKDGRSTQFVSDLFKAIEVPVIHVNSDDPIAVDFAFKTAAEYQIKFKKTICIDIIGYRRYGHSEIDNPMFTQPQMYKKISKKENVLKMYMDKIIKEGVISQEECEKILSSIKSDLALNFKNAEKNLWEKSDWVPKQWQNYCNKIYSTPQLTGIKQDKILEINERVNLLPNNGYNFHNLVKKIYENRYKSIKEGINIDMATAEILSFGSLLDEGYTVRISGQDVERGSFSHRHAVLHDQEDEKTYIPLQTVAKKPQNFQPCNSPLSEYGVLGYELGFSYYNPESLVIWEAQYGDFANNAQTILDNFIASGERKWNIESGIVLNLPHGMDCQGPEHSSARLERFLQMMDDNVDDVNLNQVINHYDKSSQIQGSNYQVCYPTTSANYFHLLRRQLKRSFRKPLILAMSKKLLRFKKANSFIEEFIEGTKFIKVRQECSQYIISNKNQVKMILVCSGQIYYDVIKRREELKRDDVAIITVEQIGPFPYVEFLDAINFFPNAKIKWVQEEHVNQGAWEYVRPRINNLLKITNRGHISETKIIYNL
jgi:2-oxoglutarate dehydrogenase E1 component